MKMRDFTIIPNAILSKSQMSVGARFLYCILLMHCRQGTSCFPSQRSLAEKMNYKDTKSIRHLLKELEKENFLTRERIGFNKSNTYTLDRTIIEKFKTLTNTFREKEHRHLSNTVPARMVTGIPTNNTHIKEIDKTNNNVSGYEKCKRMLFENGFNIKNKPTKNYDFVPKRR